MTRKRAPYNNYKIDDTKLKEAVQNSISIAEVFRHLNICNTGTAYKTLKKRIQQLNLDTSHFKGQGHLKDKKHNWSVKQELGEILVANSSYVSTQNLKKRLLKEGILENKCSACGLTNKWNGKPIALQLDHINGIANDHRRENLRLLCPNCHSQTATFAGKNKKYRVYQFGAEEGIRTLTPEGTMV